MKFTYRELALAGLVNAAFGVLMVASNVRSSESIWQQARAQQTQANANSATAQNAAENQAAIAKAYEQNSIRQPGSTFTILDYSYSPTQPPVGIDWGRTFDPRVKTHIFDMNQRCIGYVESGAFHFLGYESTACN